MLKRIIYRLSLVATLILLLPGSVLADDKSKDDESDPDLWRHYHARLELHPVGYTLHKRKLNLDNLVPLHPAGFLARTTSSYPGPILGFGNGLEAFGSISSAVALSESHGGLISGRFFYGGGLQQQLAGDAELTRPAISLGAYGYTGPNSLQGGTGYLVASHRLWQKPDSSTVALFGHLGVKAETFSNAVTSGTGVRPFVGGNLALSRILFLRGEFSPRQSWEFKHQFSAKAIVLFYKGKYGISAGMMGNGYRSYPTIDVSF
jgi:hypothetical protein